jgi:hypothetical protein
VRQLPVAKEITDVQILTTKVEAMEKQNKELSLKLDAIMKKLGI